MHEHRLCESESLRIIDIKQPFSSFRFIEETFLTDSDSIPRCFSLARSGGAKTMVLESLPVAGCGIIADENAELRSRFPSYSSDFLYRISFWRTEFLQPCELALQSSRNLLGYAIIKHDRVSDLGISRVHIFEAIFRKYAHKHNCIRKEPVFAIRIGSREFAVRGVVFAQQNGLSKCCAHVALYSLLSSYGTRKEPSFATMTAIVGGMHKSHLDLSPREMQKILDAYGVKYHDHYYTRPERHALLSGKQNGNLIIPFDKLLYSGIESGAGALVGFKFLARGSGHIIPFYGHTFNKDTWVPDAEIEYFKIGQITYSSSENWTSSFLGHDDNFGANFCIPKLYLTHKNVNYAIELFKKGVQFSGVKAEVIAYQMFFSILKFSSRQNLHDYWTEKAFDAFQTSRIVLRTIALSRNEYLVHLSRIKDWDGNKECSAIINILKNYLPTHLYLTEFSIPQLFPANERKIGEIIIDATRIPKETDFKSSFVAARFPTFWYFPDDITLPSFLRVESNFSSHTPNFC